jgi:hypothetical protein
MDHLENLQKQDKEETDKATDALLGNAGDYSLDDHTLDEMIEAKKRETVQMLNQDDVPTVTDIKDDDDDDEEDKDSLVDLEYIDEKHKGEDKD